MMEFDDWQEVDMYTRRTNADFREGARRENDPSAVSAAVQLVSLVLAGCSKVPSSGQRPG